MLRLYIAILFITPFMVVLSGSETTSACGCSAGMRPPDYSDGMLISAMLALGHPVVMYPLAFAIIGYLTHRIFYFKRDQRRRKRRQRKLEKAQQCQAEINYALRTFM